MTIKDSKNMGNPNAKLPQPRKNFKNPQKRKTLKDKLKLAKTKEEKQIVRQNDKLSKAKRNVTRATNIIKEIVTTVTPEEAEVLSVPQEILDEVNDPSNPDENIIFKPNVGPQTLFLAASEDEVFYGGARGGGKTYSLIVDPLRYCDNPNHRALFIRRTMPELRDIIFKTKLLYPKAFDGAKFKTQENTWYFPSGARIEFGYAENVSDAMRYMGQSYSWIGVDELPHYPDNEVYNLLKSSARSVDPTLPVQIRATGNPGNVGSPWIKEYFIDPAPTGNKTFFKEVRYFDELKRKQVIQKNSVRFIPAKVWDNPYLVHDDKYVAMLASLPEAQKKQMLEGDWDILENMAFPEFNKDIHVISAFDVPREWIKFRAADWGFVSPFCCLWMAIDYDENIYVYREYYGKEVIADDFGRNIALFEANEKVMWGVIDGSTDQRRGEGGPTIFELINRALVAAKKMPFRFADRSDGSRAAGKQEVHKRFALRATGASDEKGFPVKAPSIFIMDCCPNLIRTIPLLILDKNNQEKVSKACEDHAYDATHYGLRSRPMGPASVQGMEEFKRKNRPNIRNKIFGN